MNQTNRATKRTGWLNELSLINFIFSTIENFIKNNVVVFNIKSKSNTRGAS